MRTAFNLSGSHSLRASQGIMMNYAMKRVVLPVSLSVLGLGTYQAVKVRKEFFNKKQLEAPRGPLAGLEPWIDKIQDAGEEALKKLMEDTFIADKIQKLNVFLKQCHNRKGSSTQERTEKPRRKIKLLLLGDSLVTGIGCDHDKLNSSPVLPEVIARLLSIFLKADVAWHCEGLIGATINDIRTKVFPEFIEKENLLLSAPITASSMVETEKSREELIVVVICGFNDLKTMFLSLPDNLIKHGPAAFKEELSELISDVKQYALVQKMNYQVFIPKIPLKYLQRDPNCSSSISPLNRLFRGLSSIWDDQKESAALLDSKTSIIQEVQGEGSQVELEHDIVSSDGIHPSTKGYTRWASHMAEEIIKRNILV